MTHDPDSGLGGLRNQARAGVPPFTMGRGRHTLSPLILACAILGFVLWVVWLLQLPGS